MKKVIIAAALMLAVVQSYSCEICGCSGSGSQYFGILPAYNNHFVGIRYQYKTFTSHHLPLFAGDKAPVTQETFLTIETWSRYNITKRLQAFAFVPYATYRQTGDGDAKHVSGIGDITGMFAYQLFNNGEERRNWKQLLQVAAGIKAPTGAYNKIVSADPLNINMQPGTGSWDLPMSVLYTVRYKKTGISTEGNYRVNTANKSSYEFGNRFSSAIKVFRWSNIGKENSLLPNAGIVYETSGKDFDGVEINDYSGGNTLLASIGAEAYVKSMVIGFQLQQPLHQNVGGGRIDAHPRVSAQLSYKF